MNQITINLSVDDRARLDAVTRLLGEILAELRGKKAAPVAADSAQEAKKEDKPINTTPEPEKLQEAPKTEPTKSEEPTVTKEQIQQKVVQLAATGKKDKARAIVFQFAPKVSAIPEDTLTEVWQQLTALEKEG